MSAPNTTPWAVVTSPTDPEMYAVKGAYLVADHLPIEDARQIAASPCLYEALEGVLEGLPFPPTTNEYELVQAGCDPTDARRLAAAFAALAKARGEA